MRRVPRGTCSQRVVVSFTTMPDRIRHIEPMLNSMLDQSVRPDAIFLNVPDRSRRTGAEYAIPSQLEQVESLEIRRCGHDWGPATKLIPTLLSETDPDTIIIVVDDDQVYPREMIETFLAHEQNLPDAALCARGFRVPFQMHHPLRNTSYGTKLDAPCEAEIMQGSAGFLVKPRLFTPRLYDYEDAPDAAMMVDDVWIAGNLARNGVRRLVVPFYNVFARIETIGARRTRSLSHNENRDHINNDTMYRYFQDYWKLVD